MTARDKKSPEIRINRAPVLTLWAAVVAERLGYAWPDALTLGKAVAGLNAQSKGRALGIYAAKPGVAAASAAKRKMEPKPDTVELLHRRIPVHRTPTRTRALDKNGVIEPEAVEKYLQAKFGDDYEAARTAFRALARSHTKKQLADAAYALYENFRPRIPAGRRGWGATGILSLSELHELAEG